MDTNVDGAKMLLSDKKASMAVQLHPLVILNASEHFTRYGAVSAESGVGRTEMQLRAATRFLHFTFSSPRPLVNVLPISPMQSTLLSVT
jgi:hypothetical protein